MLYFYISITFSVTLLIYTIVKKIKVINTFFLIAQMSENNLEIAIQLGIISYCKLYVKK